MRRAAFHTLGCKVNTYETEAMQEIMRARGYSIVDFNEQADIYIINTCSVTNIADKKSRQMLHKAKKENPDSIVVAVGCYVQSAADKLKEDNQIDIIIGNNKKAEIADIIEEFMMESELESGYWKNVIDINKTDEYEELFVSELKTHTRAFIKIQDGCNQFCSYCIIPYTRGRVRSRESADIIKEVEALAKKGIKEVVLTGIHLSSYGIDIKTEGNARNLLELIRELSGVDGVERIRIGSLEPRVITEEFLTGLSDIRQFCPHFHLSLQSGCDKTLKNMNRKYTTADFKAGVELIRKYYDNPAITTDIIVGFPGEEEEDFICCKEFIQDIRFYEMHIFPYSKREGTKAATMSGQITQAEKSRRSKILMEIGDAMSVEFRRSYLGKEEEVLLEEEVVLEDGAYLVGYTKEYIKIGIKKADGILPNQIYRGKIERFLDNEILEMKLI